RRPWPSPVARPAGDGAPRSRRRGLAEGRVEARSRERRPGPPVRRAGGGGRAAGARAPRGRRPRACPGPRDGRRRPRAAGGVRARRLARRLRLRLVRDPGPVRAGRVPRDGHARLRADRALRPGDGAPGRAARPRAGPGRGADRRAGRRRDRGGLRDGLRGWRLARERGRGAAGRSGRAGARDPRSGGPGPGARSRGEGGGDERRSPARELTAGRRAGRRPGPAPLPLLTALAFLVQVDVRLMTPLLPSMAESLRTSIAAMGLAMTLYMLPYGLCQLVYGPLADRLGRIPVVRLAAIGFAAGSLLTGQARHVLVLDAVRFLTGMFAAAVIPLTLAHIGASVPYGARQATIGRFAAITSVAQGLSAAIGGTIAHFVSWRVLFTGAGLVALAPALLLFRAEREVVEPAAARGVGRYRVVLRHRTARALYLLVGLEGLFLWGGFTYLGAVAVARFGLNALEVGLLLSLYGAATLAGGISLASIRARVGERPLAAV